MRTHVSVLAWLFIVLNGLGIAVAAVIGLFLFGIGGVVAASEPQGGAAALGVLGAIAFFVFWLLTILSVPGIIAGIGLLRGASWARILAIVLAVLNILNFPIGTAFGVYALFVLLNPETTMMFDRPSW